MSITIRPDPAYPLGGHAHLVVAGGGAGGGPVSVAIVDPYDDRHLGPKGWQSAPVTLGPYPAVAEGDAMVVAVGPEVVDHIETFAAITLTVGARSATLSWPDTVRTSPALAGGDGIGGRTEKTPPKPSTLKQEVEPPKVEPKPEPEPKVIVDPPPPVGDPIDKGKSLLPLLLVGLLALAALGGGAWWWFNQPPLPPVETVTVPEPTETPETTDTVTVAPPPAAPGCDGAGLAAAAALPPAQGFAAVAACGAAGDAEARFAVIDAAAQAGVAEAVAMIGRWWDPAQAAAVGSNFSNRDAAQAARYYSEAATAGYAPASALLTTACAALDPDIDATHEIARELYCP